jgi:hypothetical protein
MCFSFRANESDCESVMSFSTSCGHAWPPRCERKGASEQHAAAGRRERETRRTGIGRCSARSTASDAAQTGTARLSSPQTEQ